MSDRSKEGLEALGHKTAYTDNYTPEVLETYQFKKTLEKRSRNPLFIPMLRQKSPHIWSLDFADDPVALAALRSAASVAAPEASAASPAGYGTSPAASAAAPEASAALPGASGSRVHPIRIRYRDPSMRFSCRCVVRTW